MPVGRGRGTIYCVELPPPFTVVLADDQPAYRDGLARAIAGHCRLELRAMAASGDEALAVIEAVRPDVALIDVRMSGMTGPSVCATLRLRYPDLDTRLVLMSADGQAAHGAAEHDARIDGFVAKDRSRREICEALVQVAQRARLSPGVLVPDPAA
jgi:DNA-binding NarL/FixJ family response regulator